MTKCKICGKMRCYEEGAVRIYDTDMNMVSFVCSWCASFHIPNYTQQAHRDLKIPFKHHFMQSRFIPEKGC